MLGCLRPANRPETTIRHPTLPARMHAGTFRHPMNPPLRPQLTAGSPRKRTAWEVHRGVLFALLLREMKARVGGQWVGAIWTLFEPLAHVALMVTIMGFLRDMLVPGVEVPVFLVTGLIPFFLFQNLANRLMDSIEANRGLFNYRQVKPFDTLLSRAAVESIMSLVVYAFSLGILGWMGYHVMPTRPLEMLGVNALLIFFGTSFGLFAAVIGHDRPRVKSTLRMIMMPLYFASAVIFPVNTLPQEYLDWLLWNPVLHLVELSRYSFMAAYRPVDGVSVQYPLLFALCVAALGMALYRANRLRLISS
jgi:capsular polysaccharide transport system permease protein